MELATIDLNSLLHPGNTSDSAMDASSIVVTPEAICVEGLNIFDNDDIEDDDKDKVEPPIMAPILLNYQQTTAFIDSGASHFFISLVAGEKYIYFFLGDKVMLKNMSANSETDPKFLGFFIIHHCTDNRAYVF